VLLGVGLEGARVHPQVVHHGARTGVDGVLLEGGHRRRRQDPDDQDDDRQFNEAEPGLAAGSLILEG
jgi:hypothetical protein